MTVKESLFYSKDHEWLKIEGENAYIGITDFAQHSLGAIVYVEMPEIDDYYDADDSFGTVESVKAASDLMMPIAGTVVEINEALEDEPGLVNETPFEAWMIKIKLDEGFSTEALMDAKAYQSYCEEEA
jgi:glycine cleavage system H protein